MKKDKNYKITKLQKNYKYNIYINMNLKVIIFSIIICVILLLNYLIIQIIQIEHFSTDNYSSFKLKDNSIYYKNIYIYNGNIYYLTKKNNTSLPAISLHHKYNHIFKPIIINKLNFTNKKYTVINTGLYTDFLWPFNIGHGLFDELYPGFCALNKFNLNKNNFKLFVSNNNLNKKLELYKIIEDISKNKIINFNNKENKKTLYFVKNFICGVKDMGQFTINKDYTMYNKHNSLLNFRKKIFDTYNIKNKIRSNKIKIIIIDNKRFDYKIKKELFKTIDILSKKNNIDISYIYWQKIKPFSKQMDLIKDVDIQITSVGTALIYTPFLTPGSVNINLGQIWSKKTPVVGFVEQQLCSGSNHIKTFYYPRDKYKIDRNILIKIINKAIIYYKNPKKKKKIKVAENLFKDALIFREYCNNIDEKNLKILINYMKDTACWCEQFVNSELYNWKIKKTMNFKLLDKIKKKYNYKCSNNE